MKILLKLLLSLTITVLSWHTTYAQQQHKDSSRSELPQLLKEIDSVLKQEHMPGLMLSIVTKDSILFSGGLGYANLENKIKVGSTTQFHLASITKFFVAMGIQILIAEGKLHLNDPVKEIAPEIPYTNKWEHTHPVRIIHLLEHTAGFEDIHLNKMVNISGEPLTGLAAVHAVKNSLDSRWKPGKMMSYSNPGYNVLGYLIEKISGVSWDQYINQALFKKLGMDHTLFDLSGEDQSAYATGYDFRNGRYIPFSFYMPSSNGASSALVSSASDMSKFLYYVLNPDKQNEIDLLGERDISEMEKIHSKMASRNGLNTGYALGNYQFPNNKKITFRGHNGKGEGFSSWIFFNREAGLAYAISTNCNAYLWPVSRLIDDFLTKDLDPPTLSSVMIDRSTIEPMLGYYQFMNPKNERWDFHRRIFDGINLISIYQDKLIVEKKYGQRDTLIHAGNGLFRLQEDIIPSFVIGHDPEGRPFFEGYGNNFYSKTTYLPILLQKIPIYLGVIAALLSIIGAIIGLFLISFGKIKILELSLVHLPSLGIICFLISYRILGITDANSKEIFASMNGTTISIFAGMLVFGISLLISTYLLCRYWSKIQKTWLKVILTFNIVFLFYLVVLLSIHGWIGVPIWSM
ncbi:MULTISPECIES: serine hydrolase domain-containing protein [Sphingobacterium]|uniref:Serine hydrolase domain-containing protein n=1 Tax=Sphingobacterium populi TaxID=1812824 RepID=A0ABW5UGS4_9SPHI|nr:serine hydrolase domain-containing protein [Sphingobacterium sp. CFCC 11742]